MFELLNGEERHVILRLADGLKLEEVADAMCVSLTTVKTRLRTARLKLHAKNTPHLLAMIFRDAMQRMGGVA